MKKNTLFILVSLLVVAGMLLSATAVSANPGGVKPTPKPGQSDKHTNGSSSTNHGNQNGNTNGNQSGDKNGNKNGDNNGNKNGNKGSSPQADNQGKGKVQNFIGTVSAVPTLPAATGETTAPVAAEPAPAAPTLSVILRGGGTVNFIVNASTEVKIPGMKNATIADIKVGDSVVVHALMDSKGVLTAKKINLVPGKPMHFHYVGQVTVFKAATAAGPGTITIQDKNGNLHTFVVTMATMFTPPDLATSLGVGVWVTVISGPAKGGVQTAEGIVIFQTGSEGEVTAYKAAETNVPGTLTIKNMAGVETTFVTTTSTSITPTDLAASLDKGVWVKVVSSPSPLGGNQTALTVAISNATIAGEVTAYSAATASTMGSLTLLVSGAAFPPFIMTMSTKILPPTLADKLMVGDLATVVYSLSPLSGKQTALTVTITKVQFKGEVTSYTAATAAGPGTITIKDASGVSTSFNTTLAGTAITPLADAPYLAAGAMVTIVPDMVTVTTPLTAVSIDITKVQFKGEVTAYTAATASGPGTITIKSAGGAPISFTTTLTGTAITPLADAGKLAVKAMVTIVPDLVTVTTPLTAVSINIDVLPPAGP